jgi:hypothetical protein
MKSRAFVINLITQLNLSGKDAAGIAEVSVDYVRKIRKEMNKQQSS